MATVNMTKKANLVIPQVMADMISAALPKAIKFTPFAKIDTTLVGQPGDEVTIPSWNYVGDAKDVAEGEEVDVDNMTSTTTKMPIKKAVKAIGLTDEAINSGYGDPVGQANHQLGLSLAGKMEEDVIAALGKATLAYDDDKAKNISYTGIVNTVDKLAEEVDTEKYLFVHPEQVTTLRLDPNFIDKTKYGGDVMITGEIGMIAGCRIVVSKRVPDSGTAFTNFVVCVSPEPEDGTPVLPAVTIYMKQHPVVKIEEKPTAGKINIVANQHYGVGLTNASKVVKATFKKGK